MERNYFLKYVGTEPIRTSTIEWKRYVKPQEIFEVDIHNFKDLTSLYKNLFKEVEMTVAPVKTKKGKTKEEDTAGNTEWGDDEIDNNSSESEWNLDGKPSLEELRVLYQEKFGKEIATTYKNNYDHIYKKVYGEW